jgi:hypothetical protein
MADDKLVLASKKISFLILRTENMLAEGKRRRAYGSHGQQYVQAQLEGMYRCQSIVDEFNMPDEDSDE